MGATTDRLREDAESTINEWLRRIRAIPSGKRVKNSLNLLEPLLATNQVKLATHVLLILKQNPNPASLHQAIMDDICSVEFLERGRGPEDRARLSAMEKVAKALESDIV